MNRESILWEESARARKRRTWNRESDREWQKDKSDGGVTEVGRVRDGGWKYNDIDESLRNWPRKVHMYRIYVYIRQVWTVSSLTTSSRVSFSAGQLHPFCFLSSHRLSLSRTFSLPCSLFSLWSVPVSWTVTRKGAREYTTKCSAVEPRRNSKARPASVLSRLSSEIKSICRTRAWPAPPWWMQRVQETGAKHSATGRSAQPTFYPSLSSRNRKRDWKKSHRNAQR